MSAAGRALRCSPVARAQQERPGSAWPGSRYVHGKGWQTSRGAEQASKRRGWQEYTLRDTAPYGLALYTRAATVEPAQEAAPMVVLAVPQLPAELPGAWERVQHSTCGFWHSCAFPRAHRRAHRRGAAAPRRPGGGRRRGSGSWRGWCCIRAAEGGAFERRHSRRHGGSGGCAPARGAGTTRRAACAAAGCGAATGDAATIAAGEAC